MATVWRRLGPLLQSGDLAAVVALQQGLAVSEQDVFPHHVQQAVMITAGGTRVLIAARTHRGDTHAGLTEQIHKIHIRWDKHTQLGMAVSMQHLEMLCYKAFSFHGSLFIMS